MTLAAVFTTPRPFYELLLYNVRTVPAKKVVLLVYLGKIRHVQMQEEQKLTENVFGTRLLGSKDKTEEGRKKAK